MWTREGAGTVLTDGENVGGQVGLSIDRRMEVFQVEVGGQGTQVWWEPCRPGWEGSRLHPSTLGLGTTMTLVCVVTHMAGASRPAGTSFSSELNGLHALPRMEPPGGLRVCSCPRATWPCQEVPEPLNLCKAQAWCWTVPGSYCGVYVVGARPSNAGARGAQFTGHGSALKGDSLDPAKKHQHSVWAKLGEALFQTAWPGQEPPCVSCLLARAP